jgi:murein DD-endopeptidase MepM/ murein hydrolase activator NlpD
MGGRNTAACIATCLAALLAVPAATAHGTPSVAGLQVALRRHHVYTGPIDGRFDRATERAVRRFQVRTQLKVDGIVGPQTRLALGRFARRPLGGRVLRRGAVGADVAALQFALAWNGFPSGGFDGRFGPRVAGALRRFQSLRGLPSSGVAGPRTFAALRRPPRNRLFLLAWPVLAEVGDRFGPRGTRFHAGVDLLAGYRSPVEAARAGRVVWAGPRDGWGLLVTVAHGRGVRTMYAHLARIDVRVGEWISGGAVLGLVGATGEATGPHLHFEVRVDGAAVDPLPHLVVVP